MVILYAGKIYDTYWLTFLHLSEDRYSRVRERSLLIIRGGFKGYFVVMLHSATLHLTSRYVP